jgi:hypothetical protein
MIFHVFRKPRTLQNGKKVHRWYYYWEDVQGKKVQRACRGCRTRAEAEDYIRTLPPPPGASRGPNVLVGDIARDMYIPGGAHFNRRIQLGRSVNPDTMSECRRYVTLIADLWGGLPLTSLGVDVVMPYLFGVNKSGKWKNRFLEVLGEVFSEAPWYGCVAVKPAYKRFAANSRKADIFTTEELNRLFVPENFNPPMFYQFFLLCLSAGLRLGEARAVRVKQIVFDRRVLIVDGFLKKTGERTNYNKKGSPDNPKFRLVFLPDRTLDLMAAWIGASGAGPEDYCFTMDNRPVRQEMAEAAFYRALRAAGFVPAPEPVIRARRGEGRRKQSRVRPRPLDGRKLVPH